MAYGLEAFDSAGRETVWNTDPFNMLGTLLVFRAGELSIPVPENPSGNIIEVSWMDGEYRTADFIIGTPPSSDPVKFKLSNWRWSNGRLYFTSTQEYSQTSYIKRAIWVHRS